ncbi:MAG: hypothetical protein R3B84_11470 [Zavarzinella sp.]
MDNWNYVKAVAFVASIPDSASRRLTKLFLDRLTFFVSQKRGFPEGDFDLLFFAQVVAEISGDGLLLRRVIDGEDIDQAWAAIVEEIGKP